MPSTSTLTDLPDTIIRYLSAHRNKNSDTALSTFTADATVTDNDDTYTGRTEIRSWLDKSSTEFTYTIEPVTSRRTGDHQFTVMNHLEGNFPGGVIDLDYEFVLQGDLIKTLRIKPAADGLG